eukprot:71779-Pleurochrysis_carterae.AAC.2
MAAGVGMMTYVARFGLGSGPNLTCTTLYLTLLVVAKERGLGKRLHIFFDNTCGDNKNNGVISFIAWRSSQATDFLPEGPGYRIFTSAPTGTPPLASAKSDQGWGRLEVESSIRAWYRYKS